ncbi:hypothetical protein EDWATA_03434 [Edwardsiella tarda ATCC 23685]|uniref:Uncharacterized protein n=1 Tax=Edwardsiella tarda ATCC 23685 TaxID=500638 RepID=D4F9H6_EDWTA|nr:hypothetical protein EDWATA_03434 [Edwardsiella tarda ATCC 23685]
MLNAAQAVVRFRLQSSQTAAHYMFTEDKEEKITALQYKISHYHARARP